MPISISTPQPQPKNDLIELINSILLDMDKSTLGIVLAIISKIERNKVLAVQIIEMMYKNNSAVSEQPQQPSSNDESDE